MLDETRFTKFRRPFLASSRIPILRAEVYKCCLANSKRVTRQERKLQRLPCLRFEESRENRLNHRRRKKEVSTLVKSRSLREPACCLWLTHYSRGSFLESFAVIDLQMEHPRVDLRAGRRKRGVGEGSNT